MLRWLKILNGPMESLWEVLAALGPVALAVMGIALALSPNISNGMERVWVFPFIFIGGLTTYTIWQVMHSTTVSMQNTLAELTGGDSYIYFIVADPMAPMEIEVPGIAKGYVAAIASPSLVGEFALHDVVVSPSCSPGVGLIGPLTGFDYGTVFPNEIGRPRQGIYLQFPPTATKGATCNLFISTSNGSYDQQVHFLRQNDNWTWASTLFKYGHSEFKQEFFGTGFPKDQKW
jgi:hypothetical protein